MNNYGGFLLRCTNEDRCIELHRSINTHGTCSEGFGDSALKNGLLELSLFALRDHNTHVDKIYYAALIRRGDTVLSGLYKVEFLEIVKLNPFTIQELEKKTGTQTQSYIVESSRTKGKRLSPETWTKWINYIKYTQKEIADALDNLEYKRQPPKLNLSNTKSQSFAVQQDALGLSFDIFDSSRSNKLSLWRPKTAEPLTYLDGFFEHAIPEDRAIEYDVKAPIEGWAEFRRDVKGAIQFKNENNDEVLSILNANRGNIEHTLGVDLVYYHHKHNSFVMVQYKTMEKKKGEREFGYRPQGENYDAEITKMIHTSNMYREALKLNLLPNISPDYYNYRLNPEIFYFKICEAVMFERSPKLIEGMYFPLDLWINLLQSPEGKGDRGGIRIMRRKATRYFNNTTFIELVQKGWIGSRVQMSDVLNRVIDISLHSLKEGNALILALSRSLHDTNTINENNNNGNAGQLKQKMLFSNDVIE